MRCVQSHRYGARDSCLEQLVDAGRVPPHAGDCGMARGQKRQGTGNAGRGHRLPVPRGVAAAGNRRDDCRAGCAGSDLRSKTTEPRRESTVDADQSGKRIRLRGNGERAGRYGRKLHGPRRVAGCNDDGDARLARPFHPLLYDFGSLVGPETAVGNVDPIVDAVLERADQISPCGCTAPAATPLDIEVPRVPFIAVFTFSS